MNSAKSLLRTFGPWIVIVGGVVALPQLLSDYWLYSVSLVLVYGIAAIGFNVLLGNTGQISLAPAAFFAFGAYSITIADHHGLPVLVGAVVGIVCSVLVSILLGLITLRLSGFYLALSTLSLATLVQQVAGSLTSVTGGYGGITAPAIIWFHTGWGRIVDDFYTIALVTIVVLILTRNLLRSYLGRALAAVRDADIAAGCSGINPLRYRLLAFVISGVYSALAGCFYTGLVGYIDPGQFGLSLTIQLVGMTVVGGLGSVWGSLIGSGFFVVVPQVFQAAKTTQIIAFGITIMVVMVVLPGGLVALVERGGDAILPRSRRISGALSPFTGREVDEAPEDTVATVVGPKGGRG